jgi:hypothetical protein
MIFDWTGEIGLEVHSRQRLHDISSSGADTPCMNGCWRRAQADTYTSKLQVLKTVNECLWRERQYGKAITSRAEDKWAEPRSFVRVVRGDEPIR